MLSKFIKNYDDIKNPQVRSACGNFSGVVGIILNLILFSAKLLSGILTASISVTADAFNNLSDAGSSVVTFLGFKLANRPADEEHPTVTADMNMWRVWEYRVQLSLWVWNF